MNKIIVADVIRGTKNLTLKTSQGLEFSLLLKAPSPSRKKYIDSIYFRKLNTQDELDFAHHKHAERIIRSVVKELNGVHKKNPETGKVELFKIEFTDPTNDEMTLESFNFLIYFFETQLLQEEVEQIFKAYAELTGLEFPEYIEEDKKKI